MQAAAERLRALGCIHWSLYVTDTNAPAIALYRRCGMQVTSNVDEILIAARDVRGLPEDSRIIVTPLTVENDAAVERTFGMPEGRFARVRRLPSRSFFAAHRGDDIVGTISFDEGTRSTPFLCAKSAAAARALIAAAVRDGEVLLFVDDDTALSRALVAAGGRVVRHMLHMDGPIGS
jgi:hypothetical protein